ncbi:DUF4058 family protein [Candidatus Gracilibacteria bacterium]|nr:DUF4058 family protein [Candidatus Gracilibacteria bacterium]
MASPFPGMDPYLEGEFWQEFHETLANAIRAQLMPWLGAKYVALLAKRYIIDRSALGLIGLPQRVIYPDVHVVERDAEQGAVAVATATLSPPDTQLPTGIDVPQLSIEIRDIAERRLVTVIEILSPANKAGAGAYEYAQRRADVLRTATHLLEIDLLRAGQRIELAAPLPPASYYVYLTRAESRYFASLWTMQLPDKLPTVPVPLLQPDPDVPLDLQAAVNACFALVGYERLLDYSAPLPLPELSTVERDWINNRLHPQPKEAG